MAQEKPATALPEPELMPDDPCPSVEKAIVMLKSGDVTTRTSAIPCLGEARDRRAMGPLVNAFFDEKYFRYYGRYEDSLREIGDPGAADLFIARLGDKDFEIKWKAIRALGALQFPRGLQPLLDLLKSGDKDEQREAADALGLMKDSRAVGSLATALKSDDEVLRRYAAISLGEIGDSGGVEPLVLALKDDDDGVGLNAANSLAALKDSRAVQALSEALNSQYSNVRIAAADALKEIGDSRAVQPLTEAFTWGNATTQWHAAAALAAMHDVAANQTLTKAVKNGNLLVAAAAHSFLIELGDSDTIPALVEALNEHGDLAMAQDFMASGNSRLSDAALDWGKRNGYDDVGTPEGLHPIWGRGK